ncbi:S8 family serine peptidase [Actinopolymorpha pittospori]
MSALRRRIRARFRGRGSDPTAPEHGTRGHATSHRFGRRVRVVGIGGVIAGLAVSLGPAGWAGAPPAMSAPPTAQEGSPAKGSAVSVTLVTGDRVVLPSANAPTGTVVPGKGREGVTFLTHRAEGHLYVVPSDALPLLRADRIDRRPFDVTGLLKDRYDDAHRDVVPLIVTYSGAGAQSGDRSRLAAAGGETIRALRSVDGTALTVDKRDAATFWRQLAPQRGEARALGSGVRKVWLDGVRRPVLDQSVPQIGAPAAWEAGYTGEGVTVAVLDTGIDTTHPDLAGQVVVAQNFTEDTPGDGYGHGTHVASTIAGTAAASDGRYKGVAFDAKLLDAKVCDNGGGCTESSILAGMEWATAQDADIVNLSLGGGDAPGIDPLEEAVNTLTEQTGTLFVIAAGNYGPDAGTIDSPGSAEAALTVGAVDREDELAEFSGRGPRLGDGGIKPDITAPGVDIVAARAAGTELGELVGDRYVRMSGTSMATPHVAGSAALLLQQHPTWQADQLKSTLTASAKANPDLSAFEQGAGRVDVAKAITQEVTSDPVSVSFGLARWPHSDDEAVTKEVTYRNAGTADATLSLSATMTGPNGEDAPASALELSADTVTVPAGGSASVSVTSHTNHDGPDGFYSGRLVASGAGASLTTPLGVEKEVESYDLTVQHLDRQGQPTTDGNDMLYGIDVPVWEFPATEDGTARIRLPKGEYLLESMFFPPTEDGDFVMMVRPRLVLSGDTTITVDARKAKPVTTTVRRSSVAPAVVDLGYTRTADNGGLNSSLLAFSFDNLYAGHMGPRVPADEMVSESGSQWAVPGPDGNFADSPYFYGLLATRSGRFFDGLARTVSDGQLGKVVSSFARQQPGRLASRSVYGYAEENGGSGWTAGLSFDLPHKVTSFLEPGILWGPRFSEVVYDQDGWPMDQTVLEGEVRGYRAGQSVSEQWNAAVFGPVFGSDEGYPAVSRLGNDIDVWLPMYSDAAGHVGDSLVDTARTRLFRDGRKVAESEYAGYFFDGPVTVPSARASFRLEVSATRPSYSQLSTKIDNVWTFTSGRVRGDEPSALPLSVIRFAPRVDQFNRNHEGRLALVPLSVEAQPGSKAGRILHLQVDVSVDDGKTWRRAVVDNAGGDRWLARVRTPASGADYVSLRAKATDAKGNSVEQTVMRAYAVGS